MATVPLQHLDLKVGVGLELVARTAVGPTHRQTQACHHWLVQSVCLGRTRLAVVRWAGQGRARMIQGTSHSSSSSRDVCRLKEVKAGAQVIRCSSRASSSSRHCLNHRPLRPSTTPQQQACHRCSQLLHLRHANCGRQPQPRPGPGPATGAAPPLGSTQHSSRHAAHLHSNKPHDSSSHHHKHWQACRLFSPSLTAPLQVLVHLQPLALHSHGAPPPALHSRGAAQGSSWARHCLVGVRGRAACRCRDL